MALALQPARFVFSAGPYSITFQKIVFFIITTVRPKNLSYSARGGYSVQCLRLDNLWTKKANLCSPASMKVACYFNLHGVNSQKAIFLTDIPMITQIVCCARLCIITSVVLWNIHHLECTIATVVWHLKGLSSPCITPNLEELILWWNCLLYCYLVSYACFTLNFPQSPLSNLSLK